MNLTTENQAYLFMIFVLNGILIGIIFDIFRILRRSFNTPNWVTYLEDRDILDSFSINCTVFIICF